MSKFEDRVNDAAALEINGRYRALAKLNPEIARRYVIGIREENEENLRKKRPLDGFGGFADHDVDSIMEAALAGGTISKESEEALLIILAADTPFTRGAKEHMIVKIEQDLKFDWSSKSIKSEAPQLLQPTNKLDFVSKGNKHQGTGFHYTPLEYQLIAGLIADDVIGAWEVSALRSFLRSPEGQAGAWGFYDSDTDDIYVVSGLASRDRQCTFVHAATDAIQDVRNLPETLVKYMLADGYIAQAFVALSLGMPYASMPNRPEESASRGASKLLQTPAGSRGVRWTRDFKQAYDDVVDACEAVKGSKDANMTIDILDDQVKPDAEAAAVKKVLLKLKRK
jgi:hypothetical protein